MKTILYLLLALFCIRFVSSACTPSGNYHRIPPPERQSLLMYTIYRIDSIHNYYIIYAKRNAIYFKIISKKDFIKTKKKIEIGKNYKIELKSILSVNGISVIPPNAIMELSGWRIDKDTVIDFEGDSIRDLYSSNTLRGLYLTK